jgi:putative glutamine amidotransferase
VSRPVILVTPDDATRASVGVERRVYDLNVVYCDAVAEAGGIPLVAPYSDDPEVVQGMVAVAGGLLLTGGGYDVEPALYGAPPHPALGTTKPHRTRFELSLWELARARRLPTLGVCAGMQLLNVAWGGTLWQDLPDQVPSATEHRQPFDRRQPSHAVRLAPGSLLARLSGRTELDVNSNHHQAVRDLGPGLQASGWSRDGVVEAMELPGDHWVVGVQWHPEMLAATAADPCPRAVYRGLVEAARHRGPG